MTKGTITTTRSGKPRENPSPQAMAKELQAVKNDVGDLKRVLAPAFAPAPMRGSMARGPGEYRPEPYVRRQTSSSSNPWAGDYEHSPQFLADARDASIGELRQRSVQDAILRAEAEMRRAVTYDEVRIFCGKGGCRPSTQCPNCAGRTRTVVYGADTEAPVQTSVVHSEWGHDSPAMAQQAGRDQLLNNIEYRHAAAVAADAEADRRANAAALAVQSEALRVRRQAEEHMLRPPGESGEILKGL